MKSPYLAQTLHVGGTTVNGPLVGINTLGDLINKIVSFVFPLALIALLFVFIWGGYGYLLSRGNPEKLKAARARLTTGIIGFVLLILSYLIVRLVAQIFGLGEGLF